MQTSNLGLFLLLLALGGVIGRPGRAAEPAASTIATNAPARAALRELIPARDPGATPAQINLDPLYNGSLVKTWHPDSNMAEGDGNDLKELPRGLQKLDGVLWDLRGVIQLSNAGALELYPLAVQIPVGQKCRQLHFLHAVGFVSRPGERVGTYVIRYADGESRDIPIIYGENIADWWAYPHQPAQLKGATVGWEGGNAATKANGFGIRLNHLSVPNPRPDVAVKSIDFISGYSNSMPFLVGLTVDLLEPVN